MKKLKRLADFPKKANCNQCPLHELYPSVTFSELVTFDLVCLLHSFRRHHNHVYKVLCEGGTVKEGYMYWFGNIYVDWSESELEKNLEKTFDFGEENKSWTRSLKYLNALKKELSTRENLTPHEKRSVYQKYYT